MFLAHDDKLGRRSSWRNVLPFWTAIPKSRCVIPKAIEIDSQGQYHLYPRKNSIWTADSRNHTGPLSRSSIRLDHNCETLFPD